MCGCGERTPMAGYTDPRRGNVKGAPLRFVRGHHRRATAPGYALEDCGHPTPCWVWQRHVTPQGYARTPIEGRYVLVHRLYYERKYGPVPAGMELDHLCRVRSCVNPDHLEVVTHAENTRRGLATKLTPYRAAEIRRLAAGGMTQSEIAAVFRIGQATVSRVVAGGAWAPSPATKQARGMHPGE